jgi:hypothetical protein
MPAQLGTNTKSVVTFTHSSDIANRDSHVAINFRQGQRFIYIAVEIARTQRTAIISIIGGAKDKCNDTIGRKPSCG